ncbi:MAG: NADP-dependent oxidoreductase [Terriglobus roseus]|nr:NADP-dependent oxidoreductase [Terriglobus roseus]
MTGPSNDPCVGVVVIEAPADEPDRVVIDVACAGISKMEPHWITSWQNADGTPRQQPVVLGLEFAGRVRSLGCAVEGLTVGQNVMGMLDPYYAGAMAEFVSAEAKTTLPIPGGLSYEQAAALPLSGQTAWQALVRYGELRRGQRVLIHGGAGAVGSFAVQIARWIGAHIVVTAAARDEALCRRLGANEVIDFEHDHFEDHDSDYDLVFDQIGGEVQERSWAVLKRGGRLITIAGEEADAPDQKRARELGVSAQFFVVDNNLPELRQLTDLVTAGAVRPVIGKRFDFASAIEAFDHRSSHFAGKAVLAASGSTLLPIL